MKHNTHEGWAAAVARGRGVAALRGGKALARDSGVVQLASTNIVGALTSLTWGLAMLHTKVSRPAPFAPMRGAERLLPYLPDVTYSLPAYFHSLQLPSELERALLVEAEVSVTMNAVVGGQSSQTTRSGLRHTTSLISAPCSQVQFPGMGDQALANMAWALCRMDIKPPVTWIEAYLGHCYKAMPEFKVVSSGGQC